MKQIRNRKKEEMFNKGTDQTIDPEKYTDRQSFYQSVTHCRGFFGNEFGSGYSPYTGYTPDYTGRIRESESPYTKIGPALPPHLRQFGFGETPYTRFTPSYAGRLSSGESPYTDYGPYPC